MRSLERQAKEKHGDIHKKEKRLQMPGRRLPSMIFSPHSKKKKKTWSTTPPPKKRILLQILRTRPSAGKVKKESRPLEEKEKYEIRMTARKIVKKMHPKK